MSTQNNDSFGELSNPLDHVEEILINNNWVFNRMNEDELMVQVTGKSCNYRLFFLWHEDAGALQFCCQYDFSIRDQNMAAAARVLMSVNEHLWMGHFDIPGESGTPGFRQTCLLKGLESYNSISEHISDLVEIAMAECERFHPAFQMLQADHPANDQSLSLAIMQTRGQA